VATATTPKIRLIKPDIHSDICVSEDQFQLWARSSNQIAEGLDPHTEVGRNRDVGLAESGFALASERNLPFRLVIFAFRHSISK
jgi:hypothetical protein